MRAPLPCAGARSPGRASSGGAERPYRRHRIPVTASGQVERLQSEIQAPPPGDEATLFSIGWGWGKAGEAVLLSSLQVGGIRLPGRTSEVSPNADSRPDGTHLFPPAWGGWRRVGRRILGNQELPGAKPNLGECHLSQTVSTKRMSQPSADLQSGPTMCQRCCCCPGWGCLSPRAPPRCLWRAAGTLCRLAHTCGPGRHPSGQALLASTFPLHCRPVGRQL